MSTFLDEIEARAKAATPGPWSTGGHKGAFTGVEAECDPSGWIVCPDDEYETTKNADAEFIAHARQDVPILVERLRRAIEGLRSAKAMNCGHYVQFNQLADEIESSPETRG